MWSPVSVDISGQQAAAGSAERPRAAFWNAEGGAPPLITLSFRARSTYDDIATYEGAALFSRFVLKYPTVAISSLTGPCDAHPVICAIPKKSC